MQIRQFAAALRKAAHNMESYRDELCRLDTGIGDGDHGITIAAGFSAAEAAITDHNENYAVLFSAVGAAMEDAMGGAIGPLYGAFFSAAAAAVGDEGEPSDSDFVMSMRSAVEAVSRAGDVGEGEKTVLDAMAPWSRAMAADAAVGSPIQEVIRSGAAAAMEGAAKTVAMIAKKGRARYRGDRSVGTIDPGAQSFAYFARELATALREVT